MAIYSGPGTFNLGSTNTILTLDPLNPRTLANTLRDTDHGMSEWIATESGTAVYIAIYDNTTIYRVSSFSGSKYVADAVSIATAPQNGTFTVTAGSSYYADKPIYLRGSLDESDNLMVPSTLSGRYFVAYHARYAPHNYRIYTLFSNTNVEWFFNTTDGIQGIPTSSFTISNVGDVYALSPEDELNQSTAYGYSYFRTDKPVLITSDGDGGDATVLSPASTHVYGKSINTLYTRCMDGSSPSSLSTIQAHDSTTGYLGLVSSIRVGDGSGGDSNNSIGINFLSDTYAYGTTLPDYTIVAPYPDTVVSVSYATSNGGSWTLGETHNFNSTATLGNPDSVGRDGNNGFGTAGSNFNGSASPLASGADRWKFEGNKPFSIVVNNDPAHDEEKLLGWMSDWQTRNVNVIPNSPRAMNGYPYDPLAGADYLHDGRPRSMANLTSYNTSLSSTDSSTQTIMVQNRLEFPSKNTQTEFIESNNVIKLENGTGNTDHINFDLGSTAAASSILTVELWAKVSSTQASSHMLFGFLSYNVIRYSPGGGGSFGFNTGNSDSYGISSSDWSNLNVEDNWTHYVFVMHNTLTYTNNKIYINGVSQTLSQQKGSEDSASRHFNDGVGRINSWGNSSYSSYTTNMDLGLFRIHTGELSSTEVLGAYNAHYNRFSTYS